MPIGRSPFARTVWYTWIALGVLAFMLLPRGLAAQAPTPPSPNAVLGLAVAPDDPTLVLAGTLNSPSPAAIYRSTDAGRTWTTADAPLPANASIAALLFDPQNGNFALAADGGFGALYVSENGGQNWRLQPSLSTVLSPNSAVGRLFARVENGQTVFYAGTRFDGVLRSVTAETRGLSSPAALPATRRCVCALGDLDGVLYAGTHARLFSA
ncbi:MAG: hypothetical protein R2873_05755 [Caldilineaceae bacterium]